MKRNKKAHNALLRQYIKEIENPDRHGFIGGKWVQSPYKGDDPNNRGYGIDILQNKAAAKLTQGSPGKWLSEAEEKMLRDKHINDVNRITKDHFFPYLRRTPLTQEKEIMATGLLYRGDHINGTKLAYPYYNGSNADFQKAVEDYYISKNLNDRAWRSKEFIDAHKATNATTPISLESPYVPMEYIGYHPDEDYYYAGELPQVDTFGEHSHADGGMLYGIQEAMPSAPQEYYQQGETDNSQEPPKQWDDLSLAEKNAFIANAVKHGITNIEDIRKAYDELAQGNMNDYALQDNTNEETSPYNDDGSSIDQDSANVFLKGGYKPSRYIKSFISHMEGSSMKTNRSFDAEARDFWEAIPQDIRKKITQQQADALYSYSYNVGAGNFKKRVIPALQNYFNGTGSIDKVQRSMWASKDNQLRGLANRRAQERAMFAGSEVPVYYNEYNNDTPTPQYSNAWRDSRLGPVTSINMSMGLGVVDNNAMRGSAMLGPVSNRQDNSMMKEAINTLYDDSAQPAISPVTQEQESSLDRYNEIQDYLSSMSPFSFSNGGRMYADGGVTSTNGIYHVNPSNYENILNTIANDKPVEVTMPDTTVTAADPSNYRSYYDPNGAGDFLDASTLGLFPNPFNLTKSASTFMQRPTLSSAWNTTKDALIFAGSAGKEVAFAPLGLMNLIDKDGVRKTYGLAKDGNYAGAVMSGLGDVLNAGMIAGPIYAVGKKLRTPKFISELDWSPESWFSKRTGGTYDAEDIAALKAHIPEYQTIEKAAKKNGTWLKMSDGSTWEGDPRSWVQLQSKDGQKLLQKPLYHGDSNVYTNIDGNDITPRTIGKGVLWASSNKYLPITYGNNHYTFTIPKGTPMVEINAGGRNWNNLKGLNLGYENTNDISWDLLNNDNVVRIKDVVDIGSALRWIPGKNGLPQVIPNEELKHYINRVFKGDDYIFGEDTPRKSLLGNNGDFDFTKSNIYKGLIPFALPIGIGYSSLNKN